MFYCGRDPLIKLKHVYVVLYSLVEQWAGEPRTTLHFSKPFLILFFSIPFSPILFFCWPSVLEYYKQGYIKYLLWYYLKGDHELSRCFRSTLSSESVSLSLFLFVCSCWSFVADIRFVSSSHLCVIISVFSLFTLFCSCVKMLNLWWVPLSSPHQTQGEWTSLDCGHIDRSYTQIY